MSSVNGEKSGCLLPYTPLVHPEEFIRSEYENSVHRFVKKLLDSSLYSSVSSIVSFGTNSSMSIFGTSSSSIYFFGQSSVLGSTVTSMSDFAQVRKPVRSTILLDQIYDQLDKLQLALQNALDTKEECYQRCGNLQKAMDDIPRLIIVCGKVCNLVSFSIWKNLWEDLQNEYIKFTVLFYEATKTVMEIEKQLTKIEALADKFLADHRQ